MAGGVKERDDGKNRLGQRRDDLRERPNGACAVDFRCLDQVAGDLLRKIRAGNHQVIGGDSAGQNHRPHGIEQPIAFDDQIRRNQAAGEEERQRQKEVDHALERQLAHRKRVRRQECKANVNQRAQRDVNQRVAIAEPDGRGRDEHAEIVKRKLRRKEHERVFNIIQRFAESRDENRPQRIDKQQRKEHKDYGQNHVEHGNLFHNFHLCSLLSPKRRIGNFTRKRIEEHQNHQTDHVVEQADGAGERIFHLGNTQAIDVG